MINFRLTPGQLDGSPITLKFVKFQNVQNLQVFIQDNQSAEEVTQINYLGIVGLPIETADMKYLINLSCSKESGHYAERLNFCLLYTSDAADE